MIDFVLSMATCLESLDRCYMIRNMIDLYLYLGSGVTPLAPVIAHPGNAFFISLSQLP